MFTYKSFIATWLVFYLLADKKQSHVNCSDTNDTKFDELLTKVENLEEAKTKSGLKPNHPLVGLILYLANGGSNSTKIEELQNVKVRHPGHQQKETFKDVIENYYKNSQKL